MVAGGLLAGGGVAVAAVGSAFVYAAKTITSVGLGKLLLGVGGAIVAVVLPISIMALIKLRRRDLSAVLEGAGWGVNARMRLTFSLGRVFTRYPEFPKGAQGVKRWWVTWVLVVVLLVTATTALHRCTRRPVREAARPVAANTDQAARPKAPASAASSATAPPPATVR
jgi:hypothetical protein